MFVSERHRLVFIHIHKTAGTSVAEALSTATGEPVNRFHGEVLPNHGRLAQLVASHAELATYRSFAVVRNPWDRLVSYFTFAREVEAATTANAARRIEHLRAYPSFGAYVDDLHATWSDPSRRRLLGMRPDPENGAISYPAQWTWLYQRSRRLVGEVIRFEQLPASLDELTRRHGLPPLPPIPERNRSRHRHYAGFYDTDRAAKVGELYARDIRLLGYRYGD